MAKYNKGMNRHYGIAATFEVVALDVDAEIRTEHPGIEVVLPSPIAIPHATEFRIRGQRHQLAANSFLLYNGREPHIEIYRGAAAARAIVVTPHFIDALCEGLDVESTNVEFHRVAHDSDPRFSELVATIFRARSFGVSPFTLDCHFSELCLHLLARTENSLSAQIRQRGGTGHFPECIARAKRVMYDRLSDASLDLGGVARAAGLSKYHLVRTFRKCTGVTPFRYLLQLRLDSARDRLLHGRESVLDIASLAGFGELSTFNKAFRRQFGNSPREFRREQRAKAVPERTALFPQIRPSRNQS